MFQLKPLFSEFHKNNDKFHKAALKGNLKRMKKLILAALREEKPENRKLTLKNISLSDGIRYFDYDSAVAIAAAAGHLPIVQALIETGKIHLDACNAYGVTALTATIARGHLDIVKYLIQNGANPYGDHTWNPTPISFAVKAGHFNLVKYLAKMGASFDTKEYCGENLLMGAVGGERNKQNPIILAYLIENGMDIEEPTNEGNTVLFYAVIQQNYKAVQYLLQKGADINKQNNKGETPLMTAVLNNDVKMASFLLQNGANPNIANTTNKNTPLIIAAQNGNRKIAELLIQNNASLDYQNKYEETALIVAAKKGYFRTVKMLVRYGADPSITTRLTFIRADAAKHALIHDHVLTAIYLNYARSNQDKIKENIEKDVKKQIKTMPVKKLKNLQENKYLLRKVIELNQWEGVLTRLTYSESVPLFNNVKTKVTSAQEKLIQTIVRQKRIEKEKIKC